MRAGFPHSDIYGSKPVCGLPVAFRTLQRPSSPVIAKASTTCTYSLDPITLSSVSRSLRLGKIRACFLRRGWFARGTEECNHNPCVNPLAPTQPKGYVFTQTCQRQVFGFTHFTSSKLLKIQTASVRNRYQRVRLGYRFLMEWWRQTGSNRRPPACKAGALPTELCPPEALNNWWVWLGSNQRPPPYQDGALTS